MDSEKFELMKADDRALALKNEDSIFLNVAKFEQMQRVAGMLAKSDFVPERFKGNIGNCMIAIDMASLMGMNPIMLMRCMYVVNGSPGFEAKFVSALINNSGRYLDPLDYEWKGKKGQPDWGCRAVAVRKKSRKSIYGPWVTWAMVKAERWDQPKGQGPRQQVSKWVTMPEIMFPYRAAVFFGRTYDSDLLLGMKSIDELLDGQQEMMQAPDGTFVTIDDAAEQQKSADMYQPTELPPIETKDQDSEPEAAQLDEFGTPVDHVFAKPNWFHAKAGSMSEGTGLNGFILENADQLPYCSDKTFSIISEKYFKLYKEPMPWDKDGKLLIRQSNTVETEEEKTPPTQAPDTRAEEMDVPLHETAAFKMLAEKARTNKREYLLVVKNQNPKDINQIHDWLDQINELVAAQARGETIYAQSEFGENADEQTI